MSRISRLFLTDPKPEFSFPRGISCESSKMLLNTFPLMVNGLSKEANICCKNVCVGVSPSKLSLAGALSGPASPAAPTPSQQCESEV